MYLNRGGKTFEITNNLIGGQRIFVLIGIRASNSWNNGQMKYFLYVFMITFTSKYVVENVPIWDANGMNTTQILHTFR